MQCNCIIRIAIEWYLWKCRALMNFLPTHLYGEAFGLFLVFLAILLGGFAFTSKFSDSLHPYLPSFVAFGGGLLLSVLGLEFLPNTPWEGGAGIFFMLGLLLFPVGEAAIAIFANRRLKKTMGPESAFKAAFGGKRGEELPLAALAGLFLCTFFDGIEFHAAYAVKKETGYVATIGLVLHSLPDGLLAAALARASGFAKRTARWAVLSIGSALYLGWILAVFLGRFGDVEKVLLPIASGALTYILCSHLIPYAKRSFFSLGCFLLGILFHLGLHHFAESF